MAHTATVTDFSESKGFLSRLGAGVVMLIESYAEAHSRRAEVEALERLSDDQLAARGLTRDGIVRHVFSDTFYL